MDVVTVELQNIETGRLTPFRFDHALNLLRYEKARGFNCWKLPDDSKFIFTTDGNLIEGQNPPVNTIAQKPKRDKPGARKKGKAPAPHTTGDGHGAGDVLGGT
jgi:hypothetical protein